MACLIRYHNVHAYYNCKCLKAEIEIAGDYETTASPICINFPSAQNYSSDAHGVIYDIFWTVNQISLSDIMNTLHGTVEL